MTNPTQDTQQQGTRPQLRFRTFPQVHAYLRSFPAGTIQDCLDVLLPELARRAQEAQLFGWPPGNREKLVAIAKEMAK